MAEEGLKAARSVLAEKKNDAPRNMTRSVLFDMDGVILDSMPYHVMAWQEALSEQGFSVSAELLYLHEGAIEPDTAAAIFQDNERFIDADSEKHLSEADAVLSSHAELIDYLFG